MRHKTLVDGTAYDIRGGKTVIDGTTYGIKKGRTLVSGTGYDIVFGKPLSEVPTGESIYMNVNGVTTEFIVVHHGNPDESIYDNSCDGVWVLMKHTWQQQAIDTYNYANSNVHTALNNEFIPLLDGRVQSIVKSVKIPYHSGSYNDEDYNIVKGTLYTGANGLSTKAFILSYRETYYLDKNTPYPEIPKDGIYLEYFNDIIADNNIALNQAGSAVNWWTRSPDIGDPGYYFIWNTQGTSRSIHRNNNYWLRPAMIMPHDALVDDSNNIIP